MSRRGIFLATFLALPHMEETIASSLAFSIFSKGSSVWASPRILKRTFSAETQSPELAFNISWTASAKKHVCEHSASFGRSVGLLEQPDHGPIFLLFPRPEQQRPRSFRHSPHPPPPALLRFVLEWEKESTSLPSLPPSHSWFQPSAAQNDFSRSPPPILKFPPQPSKKSVLSL